MLNRIIQFSLEQRLLMVVLAGVLVVSGVVALRQLPIDAFPDTTPVMVQVNTIAPSLGPGDIEMMITYPLEQVIAGLPGLQEVRSLSKTGLSQITTVFAPGTDILRARQLVGERIASAELPEMTGVTKPTLGPIATGLGEVYHYLVTSDRHDLTELRVLHHWLIKSQLRTVPGVAEVNTWGGYEKQYHVLFDPAELVKYDLTLDNVVEALKTNNVNVGGGGIPRAGELQLIQGVGRLTSIADISNVVLKEHDGQSVRVKHVAEVEIDHEIRAGAVTAQGRGEVILGMGFMLMGQNSREITQRLRAKMGEIKGTLPPGVHVQEVLARTDLVDEVLDTARHNLLLGAALVIAALFVLGGGLRAGLIVATVIPLSFMVAGDLMLQFGIVGSLMSLGALDFGIIVDSSVIMVENSVRHLAGNVENRPTVDVVRDACVEVRRPTMFGELIIMIVYLPILTLGGIEGKMFRPMALTVLFALAGSLVLSLTLMPALAALLLPRRMSEKEPLLVRFFVRIYRPVLRHVLAHRLGVLALALAALAGVAVLALDLGTEFIPRLSEGSIVIATQRAASVSLEESVRYGTQVEKLLLAKFPDEINHIWTRTGTAEVATDPMGLDQSDVFITLTPRAQWKRASTQDEIVSQMKQAVNGMPGMTMLFTQPIEQRVNEMIAGIRADLGIKIFGEDYDKLVTYTEQIAHAIQNIDGARDVVPDQLTLTSVVRVTVDEDALSRYGISRRDVLATVQALGTPRVGEVYEGQRRFPLVVRLAAKYRSDPQAIGQILVCTAGGVRLPLSRLTNIESLQIPTVISREWAKRRMLVQCNIRGRDTGSFVAEARRRVAEVTRSWPAGYYVTWGGQFEHMQSANQRLLVVVPLAALLILVLLYATFNSLRDAVLIFSGVPFAVVGGVLALHLAGLPFSISAAIGFVALFGIAVLNGLVLVSYIHKLRDEGQPTDEAIFSAAVLRLRPVLMTSATAALGFVPMMLATAVGAEVQRPLATVVVGGILSSLVLTLLVLPALYSLFGQRAAKTG
ncbi:MAG TPA: CusA/CzcA family heavy metal efflux RND transporter [Pirellulales bacterium]|jgi:cobalt-zinc-cadmium resistance protein CzcA|nr:CusA/CzcA family heavy metal efflux RND transporter [Pirellulales bacterium]